MSLSDCLVLVHTDVNKVSIVDKEDCSQSAIEFADGTNKVAAMALFVMGSNDGDTDHCHQLLH